MSLLLTGRRSWSLAGRDNSRDSLTFLRFHPSTPSPKGRKKCGLIANSGAAILRNAATLPSGIAKGPSTNNHQCRLKRRSQMHG